MDTTPPQFTGPISVTHTNGFLIATWAADAFTDGQEPYKLDLQFAIGILYMFCKDNIHMLPYLYIPVELCFETCFVVGNIYSLMNRVLQNQKAFISTVT